jgi:hypothetical protein
LRQGGSGRPNTGHGRWDSICHKKHKKTPKELIGIRFVACCAFRGDIFQETEAMKEHNISWRSWWCGGRSFRVAAARELRHVAAWVPVLKAEPTRLRARPGISVRFSKGPTLSAD